MNDFNRDKNKDEYLNDSSVDAVWDSSHDVFDRLTVDDIMNYTPSISELIYDCNLRNVSMKILDRLDGIDCLKYIGVSKYVTHYWVCYQMSFIYSIKKISDSIISFDPIQPYALYDIGFNMTSFGNVSELLAFYSTGGRFPISEFIQVTFMNRFLSETKEATYNFFGIRYFRSKIFRLEAPYSTNCINYNYRESLTRCINDSVVSNFGRLSVMSQHTNGSMPMISELFLEDENTSYSYINIVKACEELIPNDECYTSIFTTSNDEKLPWSILYVSSMLPDTGDIYIETRPRMVFLDYMTLCFSCFGTWLGFSFLGLNPFKNKSDIASFSDNALLIKFRRMQLRNENLFRLMFDGLKQQQDWMKQMDQEIAQIKY